MRLRTVSTEAAQRTDRQSTCDCVAGVTDPERCGCECSIDDEFGLLAPDDGRCRCGYGSDDGCPCGFC